ncbi:hypothetical protein J6590_027936 [Homalodisca vitripennis]|nr:hypothetical protein J6590_027936 [Homalodisca vitripennis]
MNFLKLAPLISAASVWARPDTFLTTCYDLYCETFHCYYLHRFAACNTQTIEFHADKAVDCDDEALTVGLGCVPDIVTQIWRGSAGKHRAARVGVAGTRGHYKFACLLTRIDPQLLVNIERSDRPFVRPLAEFGSRRLDL